MQRVKKWLLTRLNMAEAGPAGFRGENQILSRDVTRLQLHRKQVLWPVKLKGNWRLQSNRLRRKPAELSRTQKGLWISTHGPLFFKHSCFLCSLAKYEENSLKLSGGY